MTVTALVPMKGESLRLPRKNVRAFHGRPLFYWVLSALEATAHVRQIVVDTDSEEIADGVRGYFPAITILDRPEHLRGHEVNGNPLTEWAMSQVRGDLFLQTHVTNPLLKATTINDAVTAYCRQGTSRDSLVAVAKHKSHFYDGDYQPVNHSPHEVQRTQELDPLYEDVHCLYVFSRGSFARSGRVGLNPLFYPVSRIEAIDIDDAEGWSIAKGAMRETGGIYAGTVEDGVGKDRHTITDEINQLLGYEAYPGSLNLVVPRWAYDAIKRLPDVGGFRSVWIGGCPGHVRLARRRRDLVLAYAPVRLRDHLNVSNGGSVRIEVAGER